MNNLKREWFNNETCLRLIESLSLSLSLFLTHSLLILSRSLFLSLSLTFSLTLFSSLSISVCSCLCVCSLFVCLSWKIILSYFFSLLSELWILNYNERTLGELFSIFGLWTTIFLKQWPQFFGFRQELLFWSLTMVTLIKICFTFQMSYWRNIIQWND